MSKCVNAQENHSRIHTFTHSLIFMRKGIYQAFTANGFVDADELWQFVKLSDGSIQIDNETTRIKPFAEPRSDSITVILGPDLKLQLFTAHGLLGHRESRINWVDNIAYTCWQFKFETHRRELAWRDDMEINYRSPLLNMVTVWRSQLQSGQSRTFDVLHLDDVSFKPTWTKQTYTRLEDEVRDTEFGRQTLTHYRINFENKTISDFWCDTEGVLFHLHSQNGSGFKLTAVNF
jgi:hypothetical protein